MFSNILYINLCWPIYVNLTKTRVIGDERASVEKMPTVGNSVGCFLKFGLAWRSRALLVATGSIRNR